MPLDYSLVAQCIAPESAVWLESLTNYSSKRHASDNNIRASLIPITKKANISQKEYTENSNNTSSSTMPADKSTPRTRAKATLPPEPDYIKYINQKLEQ